MVIERTVWYTCGKLRHKNRSTTLALFKILTLGLCLLIEMMDWGTDLWKIHRQTLCKNLDSLIFSNKMKQYYRRH